MMRVLSFAGIGRLRRSLSARDVDTALLGGSVVVLNLLRLVSTVLLAARLDPEAFGVVGIIMSVMFVLTMISDMGFHAFIVRHGRSTEPDFLDVIWTVRLIRGFALAALMALIAWPVAQLLGKPLLAAPLAVMAVNFVLEGFTSLGFITATRDFKVRLMAVVDVLLAVVQLGVTLLFVSVDRSYWAIVWAMIASAVLRALLSYTLFPDARRRIRFDRPLQAELWTFSRFIAGSSLISLGLMQTDKLVLARVLPLAAFGTYSIAINLVSAPSSFVHTYAMRVLYPHYSHAIRAGAADLRTIYYANRGVVTALFQLAIGGLIGVAPALIDLLYDDRYAGAALYLRLLATGALFSLQNVAANEMLTAMGHVRTTFEVNVARLIWLALAGTAAFLVWGGLGLVAAVGLIELPAYLYSAWKLARERIFDLRREAGYLAIAGAGILLGLGASAVVERLGW